jgi:hypothetical protein
VANGRGQLTLQINAGRLAAIIDDAVLASSEIVNFHFNALAGANLAEPSEGGDAKFRLRGPAMGTDARRSLHERWILAKAFQELLRAVRHSLEEAYILVTLLTKTHRIKSSSTLAEFLRPFQAKAASLAFPKLLDAVNDKLDPKIEFSAAYKSLQTARNCLEHRDGIVSEVETYGKPMFAMQVPRMKLFYLRDGNEIEVEAGQIIEPGDDRAEVEILMKIETRERSFVRGDRLSFASADFNEIAFACHFLGQQLASRLPKPKIETEVDSS